MFSVVRAIPEILHCHCPSCGSRFPAAPFAERNVIPCPQCGLGLDSPDPLAPLARLQDRPVPFREVGGPEEAPQPRRLSRVPEVGCEINEALVVAFAKLPNEDKARLLDAQRDGALSRWFSERGSTSREEDPVPFEGALSSPLDHMTQFGTVWRLAAMVGLLALGGFMMHLVDRRQEPSAGSNWDAVVQEFHDAESDDF